MSKTYFTRRLESLNIEPEQYLDIMKDIAKDAGYNPEDLAFSRRKEKKLVYQGVHFGNSANNDFIIYYLSQGQKEAKKRRSAYLSRARRIGGDWKDDPISPNNLAIRIIWAGDKKI